MEKWIGKNVLVLSQPSHYWLGRLVAVDDTHLYLESAAWIVDLGRHHAVLASGQPDQYTEVEPHPAGTQTAVPIDSVVIEWPHDLWRDPK